MAPSKKKSFRPVDDAALEDVNGGVIPALIYGGVVLGGALLPYATNPAALVRVGTQAYEGANRAWDAVNNYFNPTPGHGAPGDTYVPATANPDGSINPGHFEAPPAQQQQPDDGRPQVPMSSDASPTLGSDTTQLASTQPEEMQQPSYDASAQQDDQPYQVASNESYDQNESVGGDYSDVG